MMNRAFNLIPAIGNTHKILYNGKYNYIQPSTFYVGTYSPQCIENNHDLYVQVYNENTHKYDIIRVRDIKFWHNEKLK